MQKQELFDEIIANGCTVGYPKAQGIINGPACDAEICAESACVECGRKGMDYTPFTDEEGRYRAAVASCPDCGASYEF